MSKAWLHEVSNAGVVNRIWSDLQSRLRAFGKSTHWALIQEDDGSYTLNEMNWDNRERLVSSQGFRCVLDKSTTLDIIESEVCESG